MAKSLIMLDSAHEGTEGERENRDNTTTYVAIRDGSYEGGQGPIRPSSPPDDRKASAENLRDTREERT
jgi:hypothetical protein